jgi:hypothetical protein
VLIVKIINEVKLPNDDVLGYPLATIIRLLTFLFLYDIDDDRMRISLPMYTYDCRSVMYLLVFVSNIFSVILLSRLMSTSVRD